MSKKINVSIQAVYWNSATCINYYRNFRGLTLSRAVSAYVYHLLLLPCLSYPFCKVLQINFLAGIIFNYTLGPEGRSGLIRACSSPLKGLFVHLFTWKFICTFIHIWLWSHLSSPYWKVSRMLRHIATFKAMTTKKSRLRV